MQVQLFLNARPLLAVTLRMFRVKQRSGGMQTFTSAKSNPEAREESLRPSFPNADLAKLVLPKLYLTFFSLGISSAGTNNI